MFVLTSLGVTKRLRLMAALIIATTAGALLGYMVYTVATEKPVGEAEFEPPFSVPLPPRSMADLVGSSDLVVVGTLDPDVRENLVQPYSVRNSESLPREVPPFAATDYRVDIESVLKGDANLAASSLILRMHGHLSKQPETSERFMPGSGYRAVFALGRNPDGTYGPHFGPWSLFSIDGDTVRYGDGTSARQVEFAESLVPEDFIQAIRDEASK